MLNNVKKKKTTPKTNTYFLDTEQEGAHFLLLQIEDYNLVHVIQNHDCIDSIQNVLN